jgi:hypothetical protein
VLDCARPDEGERVLANHTFEDCCGDGAGINQQVLDSYPFVFSRTASDRLDADRRSWDTALDRLRELDASGAAAFSSLT